MSYKPSCLFRWAAYEQGFLAVVCYGWEKASEVLIRYLEGRIDE